MKMMHLADLHIGKNLNAADLQKDQEDILNKICLIADREQVDVILIAGDIYQRSQPSNEAIALFDGFLTKISRGRKVFAISGNHDAAEKVSYLSEMLKSCGIYVSHAFDGKLQSYILSDEYGEVAFHLLPFFRPFHVKKAYPSEDILNSRQAMEMILKNSPIDSGQRNVLVCHQFIATAEQSESEDIEMGTLDPIDAGVFDSFDYVALGHLHKPQAILRESLRYAGSPLKYSFSEVNHQKSVPIIELREKGIQSVYTIPLTPLHEMRKVEGFFQDLMKASQTDDFVWVILHDEQLEMDAMQRLQQTIFPNMLRFSIENSKTRELKEILEIKQLEEKEPEDLFANFYRMRNGGSELSQEHLKIFRQIFSEIRGNEE